MPNAPRALLPAALHFALFGAVGFLTGLAAALPLWFLVRLMPAVAVPDLVYPAGCVVTVLVCAAVIATRLTGIGRAAAAAFPVGLALACAVPPLSAWVWGTL